MRTELELLTEQVKLLELKMELVGRLNKSLEVINDALKLRITYAEETCEEIANIVGHNIEEAVKKLKEDRDALVGAIQNFLAKNRVASLETVLLQVTSSEVSKKTNMVLKAIVEDTCENTKNLVSGS